MVDVDATTQAEQILGYTFADRTLLRTALTHPSYAAEHVDADTYDRLEFLGDALLGFIVSDHVFSEHPTAPEGELTRRKHHAVSREALATVAEDLGLAEVVLLGVGAHAAGERTRASVLENTMEALIGAMYLDGGLEAARTFVLRVLTGRLAGDEGGEPDAKGALQEWSQAAGRGLPSYHIVATSGPAHERHFTAEVAVAGEVLGSGGGATKQAAQKAAAAAALRHLRTTAGSAE